METKKLIGIFGGTFDPIHNGHLNIAQTLYKNLPFDQIQFIPCGIPPHRSQPIANPMDRLAMVKLAVADFPYFTVNDLEVKKKSPAYTIETLKTLHPQFKDQSLCLILSTDVFSLFNTWHEWEKILNFCHLIITNRPQYSLPQTTWLKNLLTQHQTHHLSDLSNLSYGKIFFPLITEIPISATDVRQHLQQKNFSHITSLLPQKVVTYIQNHHLYV